MTSEKVVEVVITAPNTTWLAEFAQYLVEHRICAGSHIVERVRSIYRWDGKTHDVTEGRVALHTRASNVDQIVALADEKHPYEVPCVVAWPIKQGNPAYLRWIVDETVPIDH